MTDRTDPLTHELDGRQVDDHALHVTGTHLDKGTAWVQVTLEPGGRDLVLHIQRGATAADVLAALKSWLDRGLDMPRIIEVTATP
jgi:hypothetical protein